MALISMLLAIALPVALPVAGGQAAGPAQSGTAEKETRADRRTTGTPVRDLPFAAGRSFASLDEYLAFLREQGAYDVPWYRPVGPDTFEIVTRRLPGRPPQTVTRADLARKFGFPADDQR